MVAGGGVEEASARAGNGAGEGWTVEVEVSEVVRGAAAARTLAAGGDWGSRVFGKFGGK